jgi:hypothetical protein
MTIPYQTSLSLGILMTLKNLICLLPLVLTACSSIDKRDCDKDMHELGLRHGRMGSPRKYTEEIRGVCSNHNPPIDLERYEKGFTIGWIEYCRPVNALILGKADDRYVSYCPENRENVFREKYYIGKRISELKIQVDELNDEIADVRIDAANDDKAAFELKKLEKSLDEINRDIQNLEIEGLKDSLTLINHIGH